MHTTLPPSSLASLLGGGRPIDLIDVRTPAEFRAVHVRGTRLEPLGALDAEHVRAGRPADAQGPCYILCKSGGRARKAADQLAGQGMDVAVVEGGIDACVAAGLPCERGQAVMSPERQVRIAAGALVFAGTLAGALVWPWFLVVPGFVGAGLVFAGVTDFCGMGLLLARMPWNR